MSRRIKELVKRYSQQRGAARRVIIVLSDWCDETGFTWLNVARIAAEAGVHRRTAQRSLRTCESAGEIIPACVEKKIGYRITLESPQLELFKTCRFAAPGGGAVPPQGGRQIDMPPAAQCRKGGGAVPPLTIDPNRSQSGFSKKKETAEREVCGQRLSYGPRQSTPDRSVEAAARRCTHRRCVEAKASGCLYDFDAADRDQGLQLIRQTIAEIGRR